MARKINVPKMEWLLVHFACALLGSSLDGRDWCMIREFIHKLQQDQMPNSSSSTGTSKVYPQIVSVVFYCYILNLILGYMGFYCKKILYS